MDGSKLGVNVVCLEPVAALVGESNSGFIDRRTFDDFPKGSSASDEAIVLSFEKLVLGVFVLVESEWC